MSRDKERISRREENGKKRKKKSWKRQNIKRLTIFWGRWFTGGPVGADGPSAEPLSVHSGDGVLSVLETKIQREKINKNNPKKK
jgi:hypothetical protein